MKKIKQFIDDFKLVITLVITVISATIVFVCGMALTLIMAAFVLAMPFLIVLGAAWVIWQIGSLIF